MGDIMRPVPFKELLNRIFGEYKACGAIFDIPAAQFYRSAAPQAHAVWQEPCETLLGPAAGPHTQLAQNIITSWLVGGRFIELKTVQQLDTLAIAKPCIDAADEGFNTEWSTEFTLPKAFDEYLKAWFVLHLLEAVFQGKEITETKQFVFNMSVGYDLAGIKTAPMQAFIDNMLDAANHVKFAQYAAELAQFIASSPLLNSVPGLARERLVSLSNYISPHITRGVTLSTMHGCPPAEIETICRYMIVERNINTFVKLNPTLLGYQTVRSILDRTGFDYVQLSEASFEHDLQLDDAKAMLHRLVALAQQQQVGFGVKLTNTLGTINHKQRLPEKEMYMSGRALFPLSIHVALLLSREFNGQLPISYSGGANKFNVRDIYETGIRPITMATDLLKPGGYLRLTDCVRQLETCDTEPPALIDVDKLAALAERSLTAEFSQKAWRGDEQIHINKPVPLVDCSVAPCVSACPISQDIPEYIKLVGQQQYSEALALIYERNALPAITAHICDHQCQYNCTRLDYEGAVNIREMKKIALTKGWDDYISQWQAPKMVRNKAPVAVIGAGPAGLSLGYFLAREGHPVTIFEKEPNAGGVVSNIIPQFRIPRSVIEQDIQFVTAHGVNIEYGVDPNFSIAALQQSGFSYICLGIGAAKGNPFTLAGDNTHVYKSLNFLRQYHDGHISALGKHVVVVGAGNTAMDSARAALNVAGVERVTVLYRRTLAEMPAYQEEYAEALADGVEFMFLCAPEHFNADGTLTVRQMVLGEPDEQQRRRPMPTDNTFTLAVDAVITAVGEQVDSEQLQALGLPLTANGWPIVDQETCATPIDGVFLLGDANTGPSSIVSAIESARKAAAAILQHSRINPEAHQRLSEQARADIYQRKGVINVELLSAAELPSAQYEQFAAQESQRCLECSYVCSKCVDVCPNRANIALPIPFFKDATQVLHLDAYCNECGNCAQFCPWDSKPYKDKFTLFSLQDDFYASSNQGFYVADKQILARVKGEVLSLSLDEYHRLEIPEKLRDEGKIIQYVIDKHRYLLGAVEL